MKDNFLEVPDFWQAISVLTTITSAQKQSEVLEMAQVSSETLVQAMCFLQVMNLELQLVEIEGELWIRPPEYWPKVKVEFSVIEWLAFQAHFPFLESLKNTPFFEILSGMLGSAERKQKELDLFLALERMSSQSRAPQLVTAGERNEGHIVKELEKAILWHLPSMISFVQDTKDNHECIEDKYLPLRLCYLEGQLNLIGQSKKENCLNCLPLSQIKSVQVIEGQNEQSPYSHLEIDQFLAGLRSMGGEEIRLVLKIRPGVTVPLIPPYHYLGAPYRVTNSEGEIIWAATVEPCDALYRWVGSLGEKADVLDPNSFREGLRNYLGRRKVSGSK